MDKVLLITGASRGIGAATARPAAQPGRDLDEWGHDKDKFIAGQLDVSSCGARFDGIAFVAG